MPQFDEEMPSPPPGVVLVLNAKDAEPGRKVVDTVGRAFMAARIAVISDKARRPRRPDGADRRRGGKP